jgi:DNA end-binding protein Ku
MAPRAIGSATVSFGLVSIPVKLYTAAQSAASVSFHMLHRKCGSRLKQQLFCPKDDEVVPRDETVKGYEFAKDRYVTFTPEELEALEEKDTQTIEITEFVPLDKVDPIFFDKAYYLGPDRGGEKAYGLLARAMEETGRCALAKYAARGKGYLVLVRPVRGALVLQQLHYADEIRPVSEIPLGEANVRQGELELATKLVDQISHERFEPEKYEDEVRKRVLEQIQRKVDGQEVSLAPSETPGGQIIDLMEALKASLSAKRAGPKADAPAVGSEAQKERKPAKRAPRRGADSSAKGSRK